MPNHSPEPWSTEVRTHEGTNWDYNAILDAEQQEIIFAIGDMYDGWLADLPDADGQSDHGYERPAGPDHDRQAFRRD